MHGKPISSHPCTAHLSPCTHVQHTYPHTHMNCTPIPSHPCTAHPSPRTHVQHTYPLTPMYSTPIPLHPCTAHLSPRTHVQHTYTHTHELHNYPLALTHTLSKCMICAWKRFSYYYYVANTLTKTTARNVQTYYKSRFIKYLSYAGNDGAMSEKVLSSKTITESRCRGLCNVFQHMSYNHIKHNSTTSDLGRLSLVNMQMIQFYVWLFLFYINS